MSKMMLRSNGRPPLARSPIHLRPRGKAAPPTPAATSVQTPPGSLTKSQLPNRVWAMEESGLRPEYNTISYELRALAKMVNQELGNRDDEDAIFNGGVIGGSERRSPLFERGRFYDEYSARRNERLKRKKGETENKPVYGLGVRVESAKKRDVAGKLDGRRKAAVAAATPVAERREVRTPRYSLRSSSKENRKPPLPMGAMMSVERSVGERKVGVRRIGKI